ncbi:MAG: type I restriction endonuclease [Bacteroidales bacterium]|nr:type I restriction endonuclease [Bacteroidales bacterium]
MLKPYIYEDNDFSVIRQLHYSPTDTKLSVDVVLFLNGLPIITMELKNHYTGQTVENAKAQYQNDRTKTTCFSRQNAVPCTLPLTF